MIDLYTWPTPNGHKVHIMLEECALPYKVIPINIGAGDQFKPDFLKISPNNKMPAMVDPDGPEGGPFPLFESGAMLIYLAEKTAKFMPKGTRGRYTAIQWLMFQMGSVGPMCGQLNHFRSYAPEQIPYAIDRYASEVNRLYGVMDKRLGEVAYLAGDYSIADMACFPWIRIHERQGIDIGKYPNVKRWMDAIAGRPAVVKGVQVLAERQRQGAMSDDEKKWLFGKAQYSQGKGDVRERAGR
ncbi:MAG: glutathione S-transferase family protein [Alphaproteobacteria bacterium]|nr:glutathione S-transferase family protein [Alphaproteobacteria bacterium]